MLFRQLKYFITVVRCQSFTEAAEECFISQSAISQQIKALEQELGVDLLKREGRHFSLTPAGSYLYDHGQSLLDEVEELKKDKFILDVLGEHVAENYIAAKENEWQKYRAHVSEWEIREYLYRY